MSALSELSAEDKKQVEKARKKAISSALKKEKELVLKGMGTRDWTETQQIDILKGNRPCDKNGVNGTVNRSMKKRDKGKRVPKRSLSLTQ